MSIYVEDVNDNVPTIRVNALTAAGDAEIEENLPTGSFVAHVSVTDRDAGSGGQVPEQRDHRLRIQILRILRVRKIHEFLRILKMSVLKLIKFKFTHSSPPSSNKLLSQTQQL